jgi:hypothetical protein
MSRWRCGACNTIIDNICHPKDECPKCGIYEPDLDFPNLPIEHAETLWEAQKAITYRPSFCEGECDLCMARSDCRIIAHKQMRADIEQATFYEKYLQPEHSNIIKNIVDLRKKLPEAVQAQALKYILSDINWYWNEADLFWGEKNDT